VKLRIALALAGLLIADHAHSEELVDLELVLAIDASSSVDEAEWDLQMQGYASAFRDPRVQEAIVSGPTKRIAVALLIWADATVPRWGSEWFLLAGSDDAEILAAYMSTLPRQAVGGTGIGAGVAAAIRRLDRNGYTAPRQTVDVSGDGRETPPRETVVMIGQANAMAWARGVTVNGLAILNDDPDLATWYRDNVIAGRGAFVITAADYEDFATAIVDKLIREIEHQERLTMR
jgi:hypothetical protein